MPQIQRESKPIEEGVVIFKVLKNIMEKWNLDSREMSDVIRVDYTTFQHWMREGRVPFKRESNGTREEILTTFLKLDNYLSKMFQNIEDQQTWLKTEHPHLRYVPIESMKSSFENLVNLKNYLSWSVQKGA